MNTIRTSVTLPPNIFESARFLAREQGRSLSDLVEEGLALIVNQHKEYRLQQMYRGLQELEGLGGPGVTDASTTIDELLYGENGAWKGMREEL